MWENAGIRGSGDRPFMIGQMNEYYPGGLLIIAGSKSTFDDYHKAKVFFKSRTDYHILCLNMSALLFRDEHIDHIASVHGNIVNSLSVLRKRMCGCLEDLTTHSDKPHPGVQCVWGNVLDNGGTSSLFAVKIGLAMGYKRIICCGVSLDSSGHYYDTPGWVVKDGDVFDQATRIPWVEFRRDNDLVKDRVRISSGIMSELYGQPTREWIYHGIENRNNQ
jgi:hypothetical protein